MTGIAWRPVPLSLARRWWKNANQPALFHLGHWFPWTGIAISSLN
jgi:hypothetical protein